jgi:hypothetical protein
LIGVFACKGPSVPSVPTRDRATIASEATCVPYPPPAPKVEEVPARPSRDHLWLDGQWTWETRRWVWKPGGWTVVPEDARYAPWRIERLQNGALVYFAGHWVRNEGVTGGDPFDAEAVTTCPAPPLAQKPMVLVDAQLEAEAHVGPVLVYPADAPSAAPGKVELDATIPESGVEAAPPPLIGPPD